MAKFNILEEDEEEDMPSFAYELEDQQEQEPEEEIEEEETIQTAGEIKEPTLIVDPLKGKATVVVIDGREYKSNQFKPGNSHKLTDADRQKAHIAASGPRKPLTQHNIKAMQYRITNMQDMRSFRHWARTYGISRVMEMMETLNDSDFFKAFVFIAPYTMPKIAAVEHRSSDEIPIADVKEQPHTITIRDMRTNKSIIINDE